MLKLLLCAYGSLLSITTVAQDTANGWRKPSELLLEDPAHSLYDFRSLLQTSLNRIVLSWKMKGDAPELFCIERSDGSERYLMISVMTHLHGNSFQWTDEVPLKGKNTYRIKYAYKEGAPRYSATTSSTLPGDNRFRFYPNPVDQILIVRSEQAIDVQISDGTGKPRLTAQRVLGFRTINVSSLEKGVYILRFNNKLTNVISQEKLVKN